MTKYNQHTEPRIAPDEQLVFNLMKYCFLFSIFKLYLLCSHPVLFWLVSKRRRLSLCKTRLIPVEVCLIVEGDYCLLISDVTFETCCIISS